MDHSVCVLCTRKGAAMMYVCTTKSAAYVYYVCMYLEECCHVRVIPDVKHCSSRLPTRHISKIQHLFLYGHSGNWKYTHNNSHMCLCNEAATCIFTPLYMALPHSTELLVYIHV